jgi:hypothetical protein
MLLWCEFLSEWIVEDDVDDFPARLKCRDDVYEQRVQLTTFLLGHGVVVSWPADRPARGATTGKMCRPI